MQVGVSEVRTVQLWGVVRVCFVLGCELGEVSGEL